MLRDINLSCNNECLNLPQATFINNTLIHLILAQSERKGKFIFRGENFENLCQKLNHNTDADINSFNTKLFMVGEKGKAFYKIKKTDKRFSIEDISKEIFDYIFDRLNKVLKEKNKISENFRKSNASIFEYFNDKTNKKIYRETILKIDNPTQIKAIRNYYLILLHQYGYVGLKDNSFYLSTSMSFTIAEKFSPDMKLVCWHPKRDFSKIRSHLNRLELPIYDKSFYPLQREVTLEGGIFPHFIIGYVKDEIFELNPHIFNKQDINKLIYCGLSIDQTNFLEIINATNYHTGFEDNGEEVKTIHFKK